MNNTTYPLVSVLVLNYNGLRFLDDCFQTLLASTYPNFEVIMIDNLSTDESVDYTEKNYPSVKIFQNGINGGFSLAYNNSFKIAKGKYFVILNNDVTVKDNWLEPLVEAMENDPKVGAVQPKLLSMLEPNKFEYAGASGGFIDKYGFPFTRGRVFDVIEEDHGQYDQPVFIFWTTGAAMMVRAETIEKTGGLDVDFVHHMEEIDLCYRINLAGYSQMAVPASIVYHFGGGIIQYHSYKKLYWNHRNSVFMLLKNLEFKNLLWIIPSRLLLDGMAAGWAITQSDFKRVRALIHAWLWLIVHPGMICRKRKEVRKVRKISDKEIFNQMYKGSVALDFFFKKKKTYTDLV